MLEVLVLDNGHLLDQVLKRNGILQRIVHKEPRITLRSKCCYNSQKVDTLFSCNDSIVQGSAQSEGRGKLSIHFAADGDTIDTIYRSIVSVNQLSVYGPPR